MGRGGDQRAGVDGWKLLRCASCPLGLGPTQAIARLGLPPCSTSSKARPRAQVGSEVREVCEEAGFDGFMSKPADRDALAAELCRLTAPDYTAVRAAKPAAAAVGKAKSSASLSFPGGVGDVDIPPPSL